MLDTGHLPTVIHCRLPSEDGYYRLISMQCCSAGVHPPHGVYPPPLPTMKANATKMSVWEIQTGSATVSVARIKVAVVPI